VASTTVELGWLAAHDVAGASRASRKRPSPWTGSAGVVVEVGVVAEVEVETDVVDVADVVDVGDVGDVGPPSS
jgi:hypothetical protein